MALSACSSMHGNLPCQLTGGYRAGDAQRLGQRLQQATGVEHGQ